MERQGHKRQRVLLWLLVIGCMGVIFAFSAQAAADSEYTSSRVIRFLLTCLDREFVSLSPAEQLLRTAAWSHTVRKLAHFAVFALLGFLSFAAFSASLPPRRAFSAAAALGMVWGVLDEVHQRFVPGRSCELRDMCIDFAGVLLGAGVMLLAIRMIKKRNE